MKKFFFFISKLLSFIWSSLKTKIIILKQKHLSTTFSTWSTRHKYIHNITRDRTLKSFVYVQFSLHHTHHTIISSQFLQFEFNHHLVQFIHSASKLFFKTFLKSIKIDQKVERIHSDRKKYFKNKFVLLSVSIKW